MVAPGRPILRHINPTSTTLFISWQVPQITGGFIRSYHIQYDEGLQLSGRNEIVVAPTPLHYTITGLSPATLYTVRVAAFTVALGSYSNHLSQVTLKDSKL